MRFRFVIRSVLNIATFVTIPAWCGVLVVIEVAPLFNSSLHHVIWTSIRYHVTGHSHVVSFARNLRQNRQIEFMIMIIVIIKIIIMMTIMMMIMMIIILLL